MKCAFFLAYSYTYAGLAGCNVIFTVSYYIATLLQNWTLTSENKITCYCSQLGLARCIHISTTDEVAIGHDFNYIGFINVYVAQYAGADPGGVMGVKRPPSGIILGKPK